MSEQPEKISSTFLLTKQMRLAQLLGLRYSQYVTKRSVGPVCAQEYFHVDIPAQSSHRNYLISSTDANVVRQDFDRCLGNVLTNTEPNIKEAIEATMAAEGRPLYQYDNQLHNVIVGYHLATIPKGVLGESSKIAEELAELQDAEAQDNKVMQLCELSDIVGAIQLYLDKHFQEFTLNDLITMANTTARAFKTGHRK